MHRNSNPVIAGLNPVTMKLTTAFSIHIWIYYKNWFISLSGIQLQFYIGYSLWKSLIVSTCNKQNTWRCRVSIPVLLACKASALPFELHPLVTIENKTFKVFNNDLIRANQIPYPAGNWTPVSRVTGGDTDHYTTEDDFSCILYDKVSDFFFIQTLK